MNTHVQHVANSGCRGAHDHEEHGIEEEAEHPGDQARRCARVDAEVGSNHPNCQFDVPVIMLRQVPTIQQVQKTEEVLQKQHVDKVVDVPAVLQRLEPTRGSTEVRVLYNFVYS